MNASHHSVNVDEMLVILEGDGDTLNHSVDFHDFNDHSTYSIVWMQEGSALFKPLTHILLENVWDLNSIFCFFKLSVSATHYWLALLPVDPCTRAT